MLQTVFLYASNVFVVGAVALLVGVFFSQSIKDFLNGVPSELRQAMAAVEAKAKTDLHNAFSDVLAKLPTGIAKIEQEVVAVVDHAEAAVPAPVAPPAENPPKE